MTVDASVNDWGEEGEWVKMITLSSPALEVRLLSLGATLHSVIYPGEGQEEGRDVVMGFDQASGYMGQENPFFWGTTGRCTNRVKDGQVTLDGVTHQLSLNDFGTQFRNHVHGGKNSFDRRNWETCLTPEGDGVVFSLLSPHGEEGYPGSLLASVTYRLGGEGRDTLTLDIQATCDKPTVVNISNHAYFNLAGHGSGWQGLSEHSLQVEAAQFTPDDSSYLPTGEIREVKGTEYDFTKERSLGESVGGAREGEGYCVNYCTHTGGQLRKVAVVTHAKTGRRMEVLSDQPGLELYTGNFLPAEAGLEGKGGVRYCKWGGLCLMTQNYRDACSHPNFPSPILRPGQLYLHKAAYRFCQV